MPSIREFYFENINKVEASKNISKPQFLRLLCIFNNIDNEANLFLHFDDEIKDLDRVNFILSRVLDGEMLEYLTNEAPFYGEYF